eukprot:GILK01002966.1.p1 GENE.GILK01002966.1~~GILK01002966.1.p1  ORF type:complete len:221 (+),score=26.27 GILK01002966.1:39-665(+)
MSTYKLTYLQLRGRAEISRLIFAATGTAYEDNRIDRETWAQLKSTGIAWFGQMPILEVDGKVLTQSLAIARFLARRLGLHPTDEFEAAMVDLVVDGLSDVYNAGVRFTFEKDPVRQEQDKAKFFEELMPRHFAGLEKILDHNNGGNGWFVGDKMTWADLLFQVTIFAFSATGVSNLLDNYPKLSALYQRIIEVPAIKTWLETRPQTPF